MRNRTYGGVRGLRGQPLTLLDPSDQATAHKVSELVWLRCRDGNRITVTSGAIGVATTLSRAPLVDPFLPDTLREEDYLNSREVAGVERNYFVPLVSFAATPFWHEVNYLSTMVPRNPELNRGSWYGLEWAVRNLSNRAGELYVVTGPLYDPGKPQPQLATVKSHTVPSGFFMVVATAAGAMSAFVFAQQLPFHVHHCERQTSLREVEQLSGLDLFPESPAWPAADLSQQLGCVQ